MIEGVKRNMKKKLSIILTILCCVLACVALPGTAKAASSSAKPGKVKMVSVYVDDCDTHLRVVWDRTTNATSYEIYFREVNGGKWEKGYSVKSSERECWLSYELGEDLEVGKEYACTVKAYNKNSKKYGSYDKNGIKFKVLPETVGISDIAMNKEGTGVVLSWKKQDGSQIVRGDYCNIYRKQSGKWKKIGRVESSVTTYTDTEYEPGKVNTYTVRAYDSKTKTLGNYDKTGISIDLQKKTPAIVYNNSAVEVLLRGKTAEYVFNTTGSTVKWSSSNKNVAQVASAGKNKCKIKAVRDGKTVITAKAGNRIETFSVVVASGNDFVNKWVQNIAQKVKKASSIKETQLLLVSQYFVGGFSYANVYDLPTVISEQTGNCYSAGLVMVKVYQALGYKAKIRSAIHDNPKRYPENMIMGADHYNIEVVAGGRTYYLDASPEAHLVYLSSKTGVLEAYTDIWGNGWSRI